MSKAIQRRRGTTAEHAGFTGLVGEITVDTTKKTAVVHDGVTAGGTPLAKEVHNHDAAYATKAHESSISAHPEMTASDAEVDAGTGSKWVKVSQLIRATVKMITNILPVTLGGTGASTAAGARTNLGLGSVATLNTVPVANGGTGATTAAAARTALGLGSIATKAAVTTPVGAGDSGKVPLLDATGKFPAGFIPLPDLSYVPEAGHALTADSSTTAGSATSATTAATADQAVNSDKVDGYHASKSPNPNTVPVADAAGKLDAGWLPAMEAATVGGFAPSQTPGASKIPVADSAGKLDANWLPSINADRVDGFHAQKAAAADRIPVAGPDGKLDVGWLPSDGPVFPTWHSYGVGTHSFTVPEGITRIAVGITGGGGASGSSSSSGIKYAGANGEASSFGSYITATGGKGGPAGGGTGEAGTGSGDGTPYTAPWGGVIAAAGGKSSISTGGAGGRSNVLLDVTPGEVITITIGAGGAGATTSGVSGVSGANGYAQLWYF